MAVRKEVLSPSELRSLKDELREMDTLDRTLSEGVGRGTPGEGIDRGILQQQRNRYSRIIQDHSPKKIKTITKDKMAKRAHELEASIRSGMLTYDEMNDLNKNPGAPFKNLQWEKRNATAIKEWKQLQRNLEPGDPTASSVERLRKC